VEDEVAGQQEGDVGDRATGQRRLAEVVDALDEAGQPEDIVSHALAPLAAGLGAGQRLAELAGGVGQGGRGAGGLAQAGEDLALLLGPFEAERGDQVAHATDVVLEAGDPLVERFVAELRGTGVAGPAEMGGQHRRADGHGEKHGEDAHGDGGDDHGEHDGQGV
jgi:hypothetical protein